MSAKILPERKRLAAVFTSFGILIFGTASLWQSMAINYYTVLSTLEKIIPSSLIIGALGWVIGMVLDKPKRGHRISYNSGVLNDYLKRNTMSNNS